MAATVAPREKAAQVLYSTQFWNPPREPEYPWERLLCLLGRGFRLQPVRLVFLEGDNHVAD